MADTQDFKQVVNDAILDADSLEKFINGSDSETVLTRLSAKYPTLQNAISQIKGKLDKADAQIKQSITTLFENGGLPATPFKTKTEMETSSLIDGDYALVTGGSSKDIGLYVKRGASWIPQDFISRSIEHVITDNSDNVLDIIDADNNVVAYIDSKGELYLTDINESVQSALSKSASAKYDASANALLKFTDGNDETYAYFDGKGDLYLRGMRASVQATIEGTGGNLNPVFFRDYMSEKLDFSGDVIARCSQISTNGVVNAPVPYEYAPLNYTLDPNFINLKINDPGKTIISTPYDIENNGKVVHPTVFQCRDTVAGFKYILGITPFYNLIDALENPIIYGTNDFESYTLLTSQPLAHRPSSKSKDDTNPYNSDIFFTYDYHTGDIVCGWREVHNEDGIKEYLRIKRSKDGRNWFGLQTIWTSKSDSNTELFLSPSIVYNFKTKTYDMYGVSGRTPYKIVKYSSRSLVNPKWTPASDVALRGVGGAPWHLDVRYAGDSLIAVIQVGSTLFASISKDNGLTWSTSGTNIFSGEHVPTYKGSVIPVFESDDSMHMRYFWTTTKNGTNVDDWYNLKSAKTTSISY